MNDKLIVPQAVPVIVAQWLRDIKETKGDQVFESCVTSFVKYLRHYKNELRKLPEGVPRLFSTQKAVDDILKEHIRSENIALTCKRGCSECCRMYVASTPSEARFILKLAKERNISIDWGRLEKQRTLEDGDFWTEMVGEDNKCVFLDDRGSCKIYRARPLRCRTHFVASKKELCIMVKENTVQKVFSLEAESLVFAHVEIEGCGNIGLAELLCRLRGEM